VRCHRPLLDARLQARLGLPRGCRLRRSKLEELKKCRLHLPPMMGSWGCISMLGVPDWSRSIPAGCVVVVWQDGPEYQPKQVGG
jgi:hypothetical protein